MKDYSLLSLIVGGDERAWDAVHHRFALLVKRPVGKDADSWAAGEDLATRIRLYSPTDLAGLVYLISRATPTQGQTLVRQLHRDWATMSTYRPKLLRWLQERWPQVDPEAAPVGAIGLPDVAEELRWYRESPTFAAPVITPELFGPPEPPPAPTPTEQRRAQAQERLIHTQQHAASTTTSSEVLQRLATTGRTRRIRTTAQQRLNTLPK